MSAQLVEKELHLAGSSAEPTRASPRSSHPISILKIFGTWMRRRAERRALREVATDARLLSDIGLTRSQALREADRMFWRP
jgi:uncharacterized protein YjiS (DUF1127 family)